MHSAPDSSIRTLWDTFQQELERQARTRAATALVFETDVTKPLQTLRDQHTKQHKAVRGGGAGAMPCSRLSTRRRPHRAAGVLTISTRV